MRQPVLKTGWPTLTLSRPGADHDEFIHVTDQDEIEARLRELLDLQEWGELGCVALRVCRPDGTIEEIVLNAKTDEERAQALAELRAGFKGSLN